MEYGCHCEGPAVVGIIDNGGNLYCARCAAILNRTGIPIFSESYPHAHEICDRCHRHLEIFKNGRPLMASGADEQTWKQKIK